VNHRRGVETLYRYENPGSDKAWATRKGLPTGHGCPSRIRHIGGKNFDEAYPRNRRSRKLMSTGRYKRRSREAERRDATCDVRWGNTSD
jgi:hypothetical protein